MTRSLIVHTGRHLLRVGEHKYAGQEGGRKRKVKQTTASSEISLSHPHPPRHPSSRAHKIIARLLLLYLLDVVAGICVYKCIARHSARECPRADGASFGRVLSLKEVCVPLIIGIRNNTDIHLYHFTNKHEN